jgi:hypothetical protein
LTNALVNFRKICSLSLVWFASLEAFLEAEPKKSFLRLNHWRFSRKGKCLIVVAIVAVLLISVFEFLPKESAIKGNIVSQSSDNSTATPSPTATPQSQGSQGPSFSNSNSTFTEVDVSPASTSKSPGLIQSDTTINSAVWMEVAADAWAYFQPGVGVDAKTGLPYASSSGYTYFTDWDLGCYIQAVIDAQKLGLIGNDSTWDFSARINDVLTFLENRTLNAEGYPYEFYDATTGINETAISSPETVDVIDTGRLFVALNNLINFNSSLTLPIDSIVYGRSNYTALVPSIESSASSTSIYAYLIASGFASFWPDQLSYVPSTILNNIFSANVTYSPYGKVSLPAVSITGDPLLFSVFELNNNSSQLMALSRQVYLASEAYYNATGQYVAFGEGNSPSNGYVWEWVVLPNGDTWKITGSGSAYLIMDPVIFNKVAFSFLALYNTTYARNMVVYLEKVLPDPTKGYSLGATNNGALVSSVGSDTNSLILDAALYAIQNNP